MTEPTIDPLKAIAIALEPYELNNKFLTINFMDVECNTLLNQFFALIYFEPEEEFYISFCLNSCTLFDASFYTHEVSLLLEEQMIPYIEHYVDVREAMLYFGDQAHTKYTDQINKAKGIRQCPVCERFYPDELYQDKNGICLVCNKITIPNSTYH